MLRAVAPGCLSRYLILRVIDQPEPAHGSRRIDPMAEGVDSQRASRSGRVDPMADAEATSSTHTVIDAQRHVVLSVLHSDFDPDASLDPDEKETRHDDNDDVESKVAPPAADAPPPVLRGGAAGGRPSRGAAGATVAPVDADRVRRL